jgi:hypothetical protein
MLIPTTFKKVPNEWLPPKGEEAFSEYYRKKEPATNVAN